MSRSTFVDHLIFQFLWLKNKEKELVFQIKNQIAKMNVFGSEQKKSYSVFGVANI